MYVLHICSYKSSHSLYINQIYGQFWLCCNTFEAELTVNANQYLCIILTYNLCGPFIRSFPMFLHLFFSNWYHYTVNWMKCFFYISSSQFWTGLNTHFILSQLLIKFTSMSLCHFHKNMAYECIKTFTIIVSIINKYLYFQRFYTKHLHLCELSITTTPIVWSLYL